MSTGPTENLNLKVKNTKRTARGYRNYTHYRLRLVLSHGRIREDQPLDTGQDMFPSQLCCVEPDNEFSDALSHAFQDRDTLTPTIRGHHRVAGAGGTRTGGGSVRQVFGVVAVEPVQCLGGVARRGQPLVA